jgi:hypothetical protein
VHGMQYFAEVDPGRAHLAERITEIEQCCDAAENHCVGASDVELWVGAVSRPSAQMRTGSFPGGFSAFLLLIPARSLCSLPACCDGYESLPF